MSEVKETTVIEGYRNSYNKVLAHIKKYPNTTVKAAMTRLSHIFDINEFVYTTLSGGKDSGLTSSLAAIVYEMRLKVKDGEMAIEEYNELLETHSTVELMEHDQKPVLMNMDSELMYSMTGEYLYRMYKMYAATYEIGDLSWVDKVNPKNNPGMYTYDEIASMSVEEIQDLISGYGKEALFDGAWCCFPVAWENTASMKESRYWSWDDTKKKLWTREMPQGQFVWNQDNFYEFPKKMGWPDPEPIITMGQTDQMLRTRFSRYMKTFKVKPDGTPASCAVLVAIRAAESFDRYTILKQGDYYTGYYGNQAGVNTYSPVIDMTNEDVYRAFSVFEMNLNEAYDRMYDAGIPLAKMRIGSLFNTHAGSSASWLASLDPGTHAKVISRVDGAEFNNAYGGRVGSSKHISIPQPKPFFEGRPTKPEQLAIELLNLDFVLAD